jgi:hypothetical protein
MERVREYARLRAERGELEDRLAALKAKLEELEPLALDYFQEHGVDRLSLDGVTLYLRREVWAGKCEGVTADQAVDALHRFGFEDFAQPRVNYQGLSALFREREREEGIEGAVPEALREVFQAVESYRIGARRR